MTDILYHDFLIKQGYKFYDNQNSQWKNYTLYEKIINNKIVCDTNDKLSIHIKDYTLEVEIGINHLFNIEVVLEKYDTWWDLKAYSLNEHDLKAKLDLIEKQLLKFVNTF